MDTTSKTAHAGAVTTDGPEATKRYSPAAVRILVALVILAVLGNAIFMAIIAQNAQPLLEPRPENSDQYSLLDFVSEREVLAATLNNDLLKLDDGTATAQITLNTVIGGIAAMPTQDTIYVGTSDGKITILNMNLENIGEAAAVQGRVVAMKSLADDGYLVAHGVGPFSPDYWVAHYQPGEDEPLFKTQTGFTVSSLDATQAIAYFATANARVGAIDIATGDILWSATVQRPVTRVLALPEERGVLVGDEKGNLVLVDQAGEQQWQVNVSEYQLRGLAYAPETDTYFAGDSNGDLYAVNNIGELQLTRTVADDDVEGIYALSNGSKVILPRNGPWVTLNPTALVGAGQVQQLQAAQLAFNLGAIIAIGVALVFMIERWRTAAGKLLLRMWRGRTAYMLLLPSIVLIIIFGYYPAITAVLYSFTNFNSRTPTEFVGLENYINIITKDEFFRVGFGNMVLIIITNMLKTITMPLLIAELIFWLKRESRRYLFRTLYLLPAVVPGLVIIYMWTMVYDPYDGLLNQILGLFGVEGRAWLAEEATAIWAIIGAGFPWIGAFPLLIYMGGLLNINHEIFDAAKIDGANWINRFFRVDLPLLRPQIALLLFFAFNGGVSGFDNVFVFTRGGPGIATYVPGLQMYNRIATGDFGYASAVGAVLFVIVFIGTLLIVRNRRFAVAADL